MHQSFPGNIIWSTSAGEFTITDVSGGTITGSYMSSDPVSSFQSTFDNARIDGDGKFSIAVEYECIEPRYISNISEWIVELTYIDGTPAIIVDPGDEWNTYILHNYNIEDYIVY